MASFFSHPAFPVAVSVAGVVKAYSPRLLLLCCLLTLLPDADVIAFKFGIPYASPFGHRGMTHSLAFAVVTGLVCLPFTRALHSRKLTVFLLSSLSTLSHSVFDALTNGGLGVAFFWPFSNERYFFPFCPVEVSPIGVKNFFTIRGLEVLFSEIFWIWLPCLFLSVLVRIRNRQR